MNLKVGIKRQKGFSLIDLMIWSAVIAVVAAGIYSAAQANKESGDLATAKKFASADVPGALTVVHLTRGHSYAALTADAAGKQVLVARGVAPEMPWSDPWSIQTAGTNTSVTIRIPTDSAKDPEDMKNTLAASIAGSQAMITSATPGGAGANYVDVTYSVPR